ncbi:hypothetical protein [Phascolarctobacterium faecium]
MENDKIYTSVGDENKEQIAKRLQKVVEERLKKDEPIIVSMKNEEYIMGHFKDPEELIMFAAQATRSIAQTIEKATKWITAKEFLELIIQAMEKNEEEKASEQKTDAQEQKPLH